VGHGGLGTRESGEGALVVTAILVGIIVVVVAVFVVLGARRRTPSSDDGVAAFRRPLDALSPEARRSVIERAQPPVVMEEPNDGP